MSDLPKVCKLKWNWSTLMLHHGHSTSCWRVQANTPQLVIPIIEFDTFHNTAQKQEQRRMMLDGKFPPGCHQCEDIEKAGADSDRIVHNLHWGGIDEIKKSQSTIGKLEILELFFNDTCNFSCIYCEPCLSSSWGAELRKFGDLKINNFLIEPATHDRDAYLARLDALWKYLPGNISSIRELNILGGEPLLLKETRQMLEFIAEHPAPELALTIVSNLCVPEKIVDEVISKLEILVQSNKLKSAKIIGSIDSWGHDAEFQRFGLNLELFERNLVKVLKSQEVILGLNITVTGLSIYNMPALIKKWLIWQEQKNTHIHISGSLIETMENYYCLDPLVFPFAMISRPLEESLSLIPDNDPSYTQTKQRITGMYDYLKSKNSDGDTARLSELKLYLEELSRRRNVDWKEYYPWLVDFLKDF